MSKIRLTKTQLDAAGVKGSARKATSVSAPQVASVSVDKIDIVSAKKSKPIYSIHDFKEKDREHLEENNYVIVDGRIYLYDVEHYDMMHITESRNVDSLDLKNFTLVNGENFETWVEKYNHGEEMPKEVTDLFMLGGCAEMALAMQRVTGEENIIAITAVDYKGRGTLGHVVFQHGTESYDVRGPMSIEDYLSDYGSEYCYGIVDEEEEAVIIELHSEAINHLTDKNYFTYTADKADRKLVDKLAKKILNL